MQQLLEMVARIAGTDSTVYLHGESGSGKEVIAKAIHLASGRKDKAFVANISTLWSDDADMFEVVDDYLAALGESREVGDAEKKQVRKAIARLSNLLKFPFTALELSKSLDEEQVAEVFVRINSAGK